MIRFRFSFIRRRLLLLCATLSLINAPLFAAKAKPAPDTEHWVEVAGESLPYYPSGSIEFKPRRTVPPVYPAAERNRGVTGVALILAVVNEKGKPVELHIRQSNPVPSFGEAAKDSVAQWRFQPYEHNGKPTRYLIEVPVIFNIARP
jgi:TonB family protein